MELLTLAIGSFFRWETFYILAYPVLKKSSTKIFKIFQKAIQRELKLSRHFYFIIVYIYNFVCKFVCV